MTPRERLDRYERKEIEGDAYFPDVTIDKWDLKRAVSNKKDAKNEHDYTFLIYERKR